MSAAMGAMGPARPAVLGRAARVTTAVRTRGVALPSIRGMGAGLGQARRRMGKRTHKRGVCMAKEGGEDGPEFTPNPSEMKLQPVTRDSLALAGAGAVEEKTEIQKFLFPDADELPDDIEMSIWDHFEELRERVLVATAGCGIAISGSFLYAKDLVKILESPVASQGVRFLALSPGEYFFTTFKVAGYTGLLIGVPLILYEVIAFVLPGLTASERKFLGPIVFGSSILFYFGIVFAYIILCPAALKFFVSYADGAVDSLWSIDQYFEFILVLLLSTGLSFQVPVIQVLLGQTGIVSSQQMLSIWRYVVVGAVVVAAVLTPSTDPFTQTLLALPLIGLYIGGAFAVKAIEASKGSQPSSE
mmetsp:Transcript_25887/g.82433  ORF Transcript_25887/g.82433 Transcript_25887/m.82433 type:complete len:359 (+) Transcript_25887:286-1362(+)|eukprot:CAMPEP_0182867386 /NCGR_PEP_ID=MMETSP0034_2-20130328/8692_1 /TAXON_ID=156128 /ORGANISM="Nephroselmis pyriformis, Strain CCMP717" /LENGTH=358 /DNA_ID=CAMNT_0024999737 /DNA_START=153 /DNA_END=1229 /DNA_ORIENTATION=-